MNKLCCCIEQDVPDISLNFTCACCESRVQQQRKADDSTDLETVDKEDQVKKKKKEDEDEEKYTVCCCCFRRKRHAKEKKK